MRYYKSVSTLRLILLVVICIALVTGLSITLFSGKANAPMSINSAKPASHEAQFSRMMGAAL